MGPAGLSLLPGRPSLSGTKPLLHRRGVFCIIVCAAIKKGHPGQACVYRRQKGADDVLLTSTEGVSRCPSELRGIGEGGNMRMTRESAAADPITNARPHSDIQHLIFATHKYKSTQ